MGRSQTGPPGLKLASIKGQGKATGCIYTLFYGCKGCKHNMNPTLYDGGCMLENTAKNTAKEQTRTTQTTERTMNK